MLIDAADATSSGASGDSNAVLRGLIDGGYDGSVLFPIVDAPAVAAAFEAGSARRSRSSSRHCRPRAI
ncbi:MAG: MlrC C-terminal domain-containing protein [Thermomicrobiales bacterium]